MICMLHAISSKILYFLSYVKIIPFSDLNEFEEMQPIEEEEDDIWENLDAQLADTVNIIKNFNFWVSKYSYYNGSYKVGLLIDG